VQQNYGLVGVIRFIYIFERMCMIPILNQ
jgi:hypothetical protein